MKIDDVVLMAFLLPFLVAVIAKLTGSPHVWRPTALVFILVVTLFLLTGGPW